MRKVFIASVFLFALQNILCSCFAMINLSVVAVVHYPYSSPASSSSHSKMVKYDLSYNDVAALQNKVLKEVEAIKEISENYPLLKDSLNNLKKIANDYGIPVYGDIKEADPIWQEPHNVSLINDKEYQNLSKRKRKKYLNNLYAQLSLEYDDYHQMRSSADAQIIEAIKIFENMANKIHEEKEKIREAELKRIQEEKERERIEKEKRQEKEQEEQEEQRRQQQRRKIAAQKERRRKNMVAKYGEHYGSLIAKGKIVLGMNKSMVTDALNGKMEYFYEKSVRIVNGKRIEIWYRTSKYTSMLGGFLGGFAELGMMSYPQVVRFTNGKVTAIDY